MISRPETAPTPERSQLFTAFRKGLLLGAAVLVLALPPVWLVTVSSPKVAQPAKVISEPAPVVAAPAQVTPAPVVVRLAAFGQHEASPQARHLADWAVHTGDYKNMSFVIIDKKEAKVYVFNPQGELKAVTAALLGSAHGDHTVPGIGDKPLSQVKPEERTTPAGRFVAEPGVNTKGEDIVWVDYDAAVSMHRVRANVKAERRLERLASPSADDNRISFGCINLPVAFYENVLSPTVATTGAIIYVLPETRTASEVFGSYDVRPAAQYAQR